ncbi:MAG: ABC transporter substrate-binding protein, partial [Verrucomicrobiota bacterium]
MRLIAQCLVGIVGLVGVLTARPLEPVVLQLKWRHQFQFAGYYAAIEQGYYREEGLEVELREAVPGRDHVDAVFSGEAQYGVGNSDLLLSRAEGKPVVVLAPIMQHSPLALIARQTPVVQSMQDLHDRPMMMIESEKAEILAYFKHEGVDILPLDIRPHTHRIEDFIEGKVDAMSAYVTDQPFFLREAGVPHLSFMPRAGGIDFYGDTLFTSEDQLRRHPAQVRAFLRASLRGWDHALAHPEEVVDLILAKYSRRHSREHLLFEAAKTAELMHPGLIEVGHNNPGRWRHMADTYAEFGLLPRDFPLDGFLYDPDPKADLRWVYWTLGVLGVASAAAWGWILPLRRLNVRLRREIAEHARTENALRLARDEAERTSAEKSRFIAFITHEVRTPLGGFVGLIDLLREAPLTADQTDNLALMERSAANLVSLISNALEQEKIAAGRLEVHPSPVVPGEILTSVGDLFRGTARQRGLQLVVTLGEDL